MVDGSYPRDWTALLFVDPYNDFLSEGGKFWSLVVNGTVLEEGDGAAISGEDDLAFLGQRPAEVLVFDTA